MSGLSALMEQDISDIYPEETECKTRFAAFNCTAAFEVMPAVMLIASGKLVKVGLCLYISDSVFELQTQLILFNPANRARISLFQTIEKP